MEIQYQKVIDQQYLDHIAEALTNNCKKLFLEK